MQPMLPTEAGEQHWNSIALSAAKQVTTVATQPASITASHDDQVRSSRGKPHGYHHPFPVQKATEQIAYPLQPAIFVPE